MPIPEDSQPDAAANIGQLLAFAESLADIAGACIRPLFRQPIPVDDKADGSPVTGADRQAEAAMRRRIQQHFPHHGVHGEEAAPTRPDAEYVWTLDPVDGTQAFIAGLPLFTTLISLCRHGRPILGVVDQPVLRERWTGAVGRPTCFNGAAIRTRDCGGLERARLSLTTPEMMRRREEKAALQALRAQIRSVRYGADGYAYVMLAGGYIDLVLEASLKPYDYLAQVPIIEGAGGVITDWTGAPLSLRSGARLLAAATPALHRRALQLVRAAAAC